MTLNGYIAGSNRVKGASYSNGGKVQSFLSKVVTVGLDGSGADVEISPDANQTQQNISLGAILPAKARLIDAIVECTTTFDTGTVDAQLGNASGGTQIIASANCDASGDLLGVAISSNMILAINTSASSVWIGLVRGVANWDTLTTGALKVKIAYIDHSLD